jgi:hypothetical protein
LKSNRIRKPKGLEFKPYFKEDTKRAVEALQLLLDYHPPEEDEHVKSKATKI